jgi:hypothetical protein
MANVFLCRPLRLDDGSVGSHTPGSELTPQDTGYNQLIT